MKGEVLAHLVGDVFEIREVAGGQDDGSEPGAPRGQDLFFAPPHGQDLAAQGHFARHGQPGSDLALGEQRGQSDGRCHPRRRPILWDCPCGDV